MIDVNDCRLMICRKIFETGGESEQEAVVEENNRFRKQKKKQTDEMNQKNQQQKQIFSFKYSEFRKYDKSDKIRTVISPKTRKIQNHIIYRQPINSPQPIHNKNSAERIKFKSPIIKFSHNISNGSQSKFVSPSKSFQSFYTVKNTAIGAQDSNFQMVYHGGVTPSASKMTGKRIKTSEEQTEYSSKHSQIFFRNGIDFGQNNSFFSLQKQEGSQIKQNNIIFQQEVQSSKTITSIQKDQSSSQQNHSISNDSSSIKINDQVSNHFFMNARTIQTIVTSTETLSIQNSKLSNPNHQFSKTDQNLFNFRKKSDFKEYQLSKWESSIQNDLNKQQSNQQTSKSQLKKFKQNYTNQNIESQIFYSDQIKAGNCHKPKISVLHLESKQRLDNDEEEELRDVINSNLLHVCSHNNSPIVSINLSQKIVNQQKCQKKNGFFFHFSPSHSRQGSIEQHALLNHARFKMKRTNTIESIGSHTSENSCLDIKFMQNMRSRPRRGVSRLI